MNKNAFFASALLAASCGALPATAENFKAGALSCKVSSAIAMIVWQTQTLRCEFTPSDGGPRDFYKGRINEYGLAIGGVTAGQLVWAVVGPSSGVPRGALAGSYDGVGAQASVIAGVGANVLAGGSDRLFSLQPLSLQGQIGVNIAAGITSVTLIAQ